MRFYLKLVLIMALFFALNNACYAMQTRVIVAPVSLQTVNSTAGLYPNISDYIANDIINELNKNLLFDVPDVNSSENLIMQHGLWSNYRDFLKNYKDRGLIDYKTCDLMNKRIGVQKLVLITSGFSMQSMVLKRPFWYKLGFTQAEPVQSFYRLDVMISLIDTQSGLVEYSETYKKNFKVKNFEVPSNSLSDNIVSTEKIKEFAGEIASLTSQEVFVKTSRSAYANVKSSIIPSDESFNSMEGETETMDGLPSIDLNENYLIEKRKYSFKNWVKERTNF